MDYNNRLKVLVTAELIHSELDRYSNLFEFIVCGYGVNHEMLDPSTFMELCRDADVIVSEFDTVDKKVIDAAQKLKLIICCRSNVRTVVDVDYAKAKGIRVTRNNGRNKDAVSEYTLALILDLMKNISLTNSIIHSGKLDELSGNMPEGYGDTLWGLDASSPYVVYRGRSIRNTTVGIIGFGQCGRAVHSKLRILGFKTLIYDHRPERKNIPPPELTDLDTLLSESDIVTLHITGNPGDKPMFDKISFEKMKRTAYFINTSRGFLVDESDLINALKSNLIAGAAIDVAVTEPLTNDDALLTAPNLIITPHIGGSSIDTLMHGTGMVIETLLSYIDRKPLRNEV